MMILVMGVAGSGKSTVARALAQALALELIEGDDFHPQENVQKMSRGMPLTDEDRWPWLDALAQAMQKVRDRGADAVLTCSALKQAYRDRLMAPDVQLVFLKVSASVAHARLAHRAGHFFPAALLQSQLQTLEEPRDALVVDADQDLDAVLGTILARLPHIR